MKKILIIALAVVGGFFLLSIALAAAGLLSSEDSSEDSDVRAKAMVDTFNQYVQDFAYPSVELLSPCFGGNGVGNVRSASCQEWAKWTNLNMRELNGVIDELEGPVGDPAMDRWRAKELSALQTARAAYRTMIRAAAAMDQAGWVSGVRQFRDAQLLGQEAQAILDSLLN